MVNRFIIPLDKVLLPVYIGLLLETRRWFVEKNTFVSIAFITCYVMFVSVLNWGTNDILIFYPILYIWAAFLAASSEYVDVRMIRCALFFNIVAGLVFLFAHYMGGGMFGVFSLGQKGLSFLVAPMGFSPTVQVYGTCCILWLILYFEVGKRPFFEVFIVLLCLLLTLNRASLLFLVILFFYYKRAVFYGIVCAFGVLCVVFFEQLQVILFSSSTLSSRAQLRQGAEISYWQSHDVWVYLLGRANHQTSVDVAQLTYWKNPYIENGIDFVAHSYGMIGLVLYAVGVIVLAIYFYKLKRYELAAFSLYYLTVVQFLTNEYLASSFFFFLVVMLKLANPVSKKVIA